MLDENLSLTKNLSDEEREDIEWRKCRKSLLYYLKNYVYVQDAVLQARVSWEDWAHLVELIKLVQEWFDSPHPRTPLYVLIFKSRQVGATTTIVGIVNWLLQFHESTRVLGLSKREDDASELLVKARYTNSQHPDFLKYKFDPDQSSLIGVPATHSRIRALPSTETAGRSTDATLVFCDEWEFHPYAEANFAAVKPTIDKGGIFIGASTVDKLKMDSFAKQKWHEAKKGENNFTTLFWDYFVVPGRNEETYKASTSGLPEWQKEAEYPRSEEEALSPPMSTGFFNREALNDMLADVYKPIEVRDNGKTRIFKKPISGRKYVMAVDSSEGAVDPSACIVQDYVTEEDVACIHGKISQEEQAQIIFGLWNEYGEPFISVETNARGMVLIEKLMNMGVDNWYYSDEKKEKVGWWTGGNQHPGGTRQLMLAELSDKINSRAIRIPMEDAINEFFSFSWIDEKPQAIRGAHDDWVMVHAQLNQIRKSCKGKTKIGVSSFKYREG